ncbi:hypothetical protein F5B20DRAFT_590974 [Whalleya microplaca]|nr:hypothetical protein F5B20DRAFT_590974 [Whalleya microplaca]
MCYVQNIHTSEHHNLLNLDAAERERHACDRRRPRDSFGGECTLHACCRVHSEIVIRCSRAEPCGELDAIEEEVFVPAPARGRGCGGILGSRTYASLSANATTLAAQALMMTVVAQEDIDHLTVVSTVVGAKTPTARTADVNGAVVPLILQMVVPQQGTRRLRSREFKQNQSMRGRVKGVGV